MILPIFAKHKWGGSDRLDSMSERFERHKQPWTADELGLLRTLAGKGKGLKEIAKALNRTEESTRDAAKQHGMTIAKLR